ncbi:MAG: manganese efflux pump [Firmicutes bacterium]|nr:manganese efflux pump [Bacillota bacterium]
MSPPSIILIVLSCTLDNFVVGVLYGSKGVAVPFTTNVLIAGVTSGGTLLCAIAGRMVSRFLPARLPHVAGSLAVAVMGAFIVARESLGLQHPRNAPGGPPAHRRGLSVRALAEVLENPLIGEAPLRGRLAAGEGLVVALALSLNNFAGGFAAGMAGACLPVAAASLMVLSMLTMWAGLAAGRACAARSLREASGTVAGLILIAIGTYELARGCRR